MESTFPMEFTRQMTVAKDHSHHAGVSRAPPRKRRPWNRSDVCPATTVHTQQTKNIFEESDTTTGRRQSLDFFRKRSLRRTYQATQCRGMPRECADVPTGRQPPRKKRLGCEEGGGVWRWGDTPRSHGSGRRLSQRVFALVCSVAFR